MANKEPVIFYCDFRSPPAGLGSFGEDILVQDEGSCPKVEEGIYTEIIKLNYDVCESKENYSKFISFLMSKGVTHVYNPEIETTHLTMRYRDSCYPINLYKEEVLSWY